MPRLKRTDKRRHELTLEVMTLLVQMYPGAWAEFWGGPDRGRDAFAALRHLEHLDARPDETYEAWLARKAADLAEDRAAPDPRLEHPSR